MKRRDFITGASATTLSFAWPKPARAVGRTPGQILGPYYPVIKPIETDVDLTTVSGRAVRARGKIVKVFGRVLNELGRPVSGAQIDVWQADAQGHYAHQSDRTQGAFDPNFQGFASLSTDADGVYEFTTVKPAPYPDDGVGNMRAPHIHFQVTGKINRLVTQLYFRGEALNESDRVLAFARTNRERLIASLSDKADADGRLGMNWDIVLRDG